MSVEGTDRLARRAALAQRLCMLHRAKDRLRLIKSRLAVLYRHRRGRFIADVWHGRA